MRFLRDTDDDVGHLLFAVMTAAYICVGVRLEEQDLQHAFGRSYE